MTLWQEWRNEFRTSFTIMNFKFLWLQLQRSWVPACVQHSPHSAINALGGPATPQLATHLDKIMDSLEVRWLSQVKLPLQLCIWLIGVGALQVGISNYLEESRRQLPLCTGQFMNFNESSNNLPKKPGPFWRLSRLLAPELTKLYTEL